MDENIQKSYPVDSQQPSNVTYHNQVPLNSPNSRPYTSTNWHSSQKSYTSTIGSSSHPRPSPSPQQRYHGSSQSSQHSQILQLDQNNPNTYNSGPPSPRSDRGSVTSTSFLESIDPSSLPHKRSKLAELYHTKLDAILQRIQRVQADRDFYYAEAKKQKNRANGMESLLNKEQALLNELQKSLAQEATRLDEVRASQINKIRDEKDQREKKKRQIQEEKTLFQKTSDAWRKEEEGIIQEIQQVIILITHAKDVCVNFQKEQVALQDSITQIHQLFQNLQASLQLVPLAWNPADMEDPEKCKSLIRNHTSAVLAEFEQKLRLKNQEFTKTKIMEKTKQRNERILLESKADSIKRNVTQLQDSLKSSKLALNETIAHLDKKQNQDKQLDVELQTQERAKHSHQRQVESRDTPDSASSDLNSLEKAILDTIQTLNNDCKQKEEEVVSLRQSLQQVQSRNKDLAIIQELVSQQQARLDTLRSSLARLRNEIKQTPEKKILLENEYKDNLQKSNDIKQEIQLLSQELNTLKKERTDKEVELAQSRDTCNNYEKELKFVKEKLSTVGKDKLQLIRKTFDSLFQENDTLEKTNKMQESQLATLENKLYNYQDIAITVKSSAKFLHSPENPENQKEIKNPTWPLAVLLYTFWFFKGLVTFLLRPSGR